MNRTPLTPVALLDRAAACFANSVAIIDDGQVFTYKEFASRAHRLVGLLLANGIRKGDRVAALCSNSSVMLELHNGVPMAGAVLVPINTRLSQAEIEYILDHSGVRFLFATQEFAPKASNAAKHNGVNLILAGAPDSEYEECLKRAHSEPTAELDENSLLAINYTSGSTGRPKAVMYNHRGAYLQALAMAYHTGLTINSSYLWTLPMFHCNGWCFTWSVTAAASTHVCVRRFNPKEVWLSICGGHITHLSGAPTVLHMIADAATAMPGSKPARIVNVQIGGAPPSPTLLQQLQRLNMAVTHFYGLTETYGPAVVNQWQSAWSNKSHDEQLRLNTRQGIANIVTGAITVFDQEGKQVVADGTTVGEIVVRGNNVCMGYFRDEEATAAAHIGEWFRTGDLGVLHPDGYVELRDRIKDLIISGGENVSSVEIERVLVEHPAVLEAAVVGRADHFWGEVPVAFVKLRPGKKASEAELIEFVRSRVAHFKAPKEIRFEELPKTSTGKLQKHELRARL